MIIIRTDDHVALLVSLANTLDLEANADLLRTSGGVIRWLVEHGIAATSEQVSLEDHAALVELRDAMRGLIASSGTGGAGPEAIEIVSRVAGRIPLYLAFGAAGGPRLEPMATSPVDRAAGAILAALYLAFEDGSWPRLKICKNPDCQWVFYDRSKNRARVWCEMAVCGNRTKARSFRARRKPAIEGGAGGTGGALPPGS